MTKPISFTRSASIAPNTFNEIQRTVEVVLSTGASVDRPGFREHLPIKNVRKLESLQGVPVLDAHNQSSTRAVVGVIEKAWIAEGEIRALVRFSERDDLKGFVKDVQTGILRNLSIGYRVLKWQDAVNSQGIRERTALAWEIFESSFVPIGADPGAQTRSHQMTKKTKGAANPALENEEVEGAETPANDNAVATRNASFRALGAQTGMSREFVDSHIDDAEADMITFRAAVNAELQTRGATAPRARVLTDNAAPAVTLERQIGGLYARATGAKPDDAAREFIGMSIRDHADMMLQRAGVRTFGLSVEDRLTRALGTTDLPQLLTGVGARALLAKYAVAQSPIVQLAKKTSLTDFRAASRLRAGEFGELLPLGEHGEIQHTSREESKETIQLQTYARRIDYSMRAMVSDDLSALTDASEQFGVAAAARDAAEVVGVLTSNPQMDDSQTLFSVAHKNNMSFALIDIQNMDEVRIAMRGTKGLDGQTLLNIAPKYLVVSPELETSAEQFVSAYNAQAYQDTNPFAAKLVIMVEPRLPAWQWYVFASPELAPIVELAHLAGREGPQIESQQAWDTWGVSFRCIHHVGAAAIGWRGAFRVETGDPDDSNSAGA